MLCNIAGVPQHRLKQHDDESYSVRADAAAHAGRQHAYRHVPHSPIENKELDHDLPTKKHENTKNGKKKFQRD
jgi:hypothetical protein